MHTRRAVKTIIGHFLTRFNFFCFDFFNISININNRSNHNNNDNTKFR